MSGKVTEVTPIVAFVEKGNFFGNTRLWGRHVLYNSHELYLLGQKSSSPPIIGQITNIFPIMGSVEDITP